MTGMYLSNNVFGSQIDIYIRYYYHPKITVFLVFKKVDRFKKNYRPTSALNVFSEVFERFILNQITPYLNDMLSVFLSLLTDNITVAICFTVPF